VVTGPVSVVVPAHNEGPAVADCLQALGRGPGHDLLDVVVVANGCTDDTAEHARAAAQALPHARVLEVPQASKARALNVGDAAALHFPRVYLDADLRVDAASVHRLVAALDDEAGVLAAGLRSRLVDGHSSRLVRAYQRVWTRLPSVHDGLVGNGIVAVSRGGRARFDTFPDVMGDDFFLDRTFAAAQKRVLDGGAEVLAPARLRDLLRRKVRVYEGNRQVLERLAPAEPSPRMPGWLTVVRREPTRAADAAVFVGVSVVAKLMTRQARSRGAAGWARDDSRTVSGRNAS
jgi:glycosyltransferase involved in cell wall biosynthesis